jgi:hypothetical protein
MNNITYPGKHMRCFEINLEAIFYALANPVTKRRAQFGMAWLRSNPPLLLDVRM